MKLAFVIPWYARDIPGGAETLCREWVQHLANAGFEVEVLTTTIQQLQSNWNKAHYRGGEYQEDGVTIRRFPLRPGDHHLFNYVNAKLLGGLSATPEEEERFVSEGPNSEELVSFIRANRERYLFFFTPYMFGTTCHGVQAAGDRAILIPCLHEEPYAYLSPVRDAFESARGLIFNSYPEKALAERLYNIGHKKSIVLGLGVDGHLPADAESFQQKFDQREPFILCVGRKDRTKNTHLLVEYFRHYKLLNPSSPLHLLLVGNGSMDSSYPSVRDLGFLKSQDKYNAYAAATVFCNPSLKESLSIVLMEAWLCGIPVMVHGDCAVTADFVKRSGGGLQFSDFYEFEAGLGYLAQNAAVRALMAVSGANFVRAHFSWESLLNRFCRWLDELQS